jgi:hypothetical protein
MKITINFATQPYQETQRFMLRWRLILSGAALLAIVLLSASVASILDWRTTRMQAAELRRQIDEQDRMRSQVETLLSRPDNQQIRMRAELLNSAIARKAFSWTEVFTDLERVMPPRLHVTSIHPEVNSDDQLELHLSVSGSSREDGIKLVRRLEQSSHFALARINNEENLDPQKGTKSEVIQFHITAVYIPGFARTKPAAGEKERADGVATPPPAAVEKRAREPERGE